MSGATETGVDATPPSEFDPSNVAEIFHTALRKAVDSKASAACWNMLYFMSDRTRRSFYDHLSAKLAGGPFDAGSLRRAALSWSAEYREDEDRHEISAFGAVLELHPLEDWVSISQFIRVCGAAPEMDWDEDARSLWIDGEKSHLSLAFHDDEGLEIATAEQRLARIGGETARIWSVSCPGLSVPDVVGGAEVLPRVVETVRRELRVKRFERLDSKSRPEIVASYEGLDVAPAPAASDDVDARFLALTGGEPTIVLRRPMRDQGVDVVQFVYAKADADAPSGFQFRSARIGVADAGRDRIWRSSIQGWVEGTERREIPRIGMGVDDDMVKATIHLDHADDVLSLRVVLEKIGSNARVLAEREVVVAGVRRTGPEAEVPAP